MTSTTAGPPDWAALRARLAGELVLPADPGFELASRPFNALYSGRRPAAVARCVRPSDVQACVEVARQSRLPVAARSGGHSYGAYSTPQDGLVIDVGPLARVEVQGDATATIGAGARLGNVYTALAGQGRSLPAGTCPTVGITGLTLGGGLGVLNRLHGLTCDKLASAQVVLADGSMVTAGREDDADLLWALRGGGGGNFGVVVELTFDTVPAVDVTVFQVRWPAGSAPDVLGAWQQWVQQLPDELWSNIGIAAGSPPTCHVAGCFVGGPGPLRGLLDDLVRRAGGTPASRSQRAMDHLAAMGYFAGCSPLEQPRCTAPEPEPFVASSRVVAQAVADPGALVALVDGVRGINLLLDSLGGAVARVPVGATAFCHRAALASVQVYATVDIAPGSGAPATVRREVSRIEAALAGLAGPGAYINYLDPEQADWAQASYGPNLPRLKELAARYDPDRVFAFAQAVPV